MGVNIKKIFIGKTVHSQLIKHEIMFYLQRLTMFFPLFIRGGSSESSIRKNYDLMLRFSLQILYK